MNAIETTGLSRRYRHLEAVHSLDLAVPAGAVFALLGPNGAGKSTTIKMLMNLLTPSSGSARVLGTDSRMLGPAELQRIGYVAESIVLPEWMTVQGFLDYCRAFYPKWDRELEKTLLEKFELPPRQKIKHLSRGMRMKALLLSVLPYHPALLVLDEPFTGLDPVVRDDFIRGLLEVSGAGEWTVFLSSHDIEEVERLADRVAFLDGGRLQLSETLESLQARFRRVEITRADDARPPLLPKTWGDFSESGRLARFVETRFDDATEAKCRELFPRASVSIQTMPLRDIYLTLARNFRDRALRPTPN